MRFTPKNFPTRVIVIDLNEQPPLERMNCLGCGTLVEALWHNDTLCETCFEKWSERYSRRKPKSRKAKAREIDPDFFIE